MKKTEQRKNVERHIVSAVFQAPLFGSHDPALNHAASKRKWESEIKEDQILFQLNHIQIKADDILGPESLDPLLEAIVSKMIVPSPGSTTDSELSDSQRKAFRRATQDRENLFITGGAGTGKTYLIHRLIEDWVQRQGLWVIALAPTGVAASHLKSMGTSLHSYLQLAPTKKPIKIENHFKKLRKTKAGRRALLRFQYPEVILIDEISMVDAKMLNDLNTVLQLANLTTKPFGGKQIVCVGDFFQLPPVSGKFCFETNIWKLTFPPRQAVQLLETFRQKDPTFIALLNRCRIGQLNVADWKCLRSRHTTSLPSTDLTTHPILLCCTREEVNQYNSALEFQLEQNKVQRLQSKSVIRLKPFTDKQTKSFEWKQKEFDVRWTQKGAEEKADFFRFMCERNRTPELAMEIVKENRNNEFSCHVGSKVMLTVNWDISRGLVSGRQGYVSSLHPMCVQFDHMKEPIEVPKWQWQEVCCKGYIVLEQYPLVLAWAITIHKSQGLTFREACLCLSSLFSPGQAYVALSRISNLEGLRILNLTDKRSCFVCSSTVMDFYLGCFPETFVREQPEWMRPKVKNKRNKRKRQEKEEQSCPNPSPTNLSSTNQSPTQNPSNTQKEEPALGEIILQKSNQSPSRSSANTQEQGPALKKTKLSGSSQTFLETQDLGSWISFLQKNNQ
jgi:ATP-dependent DNA helicase PIF1